MVPSKLILMQLLTRDIGTCFRALIRDVNGCVQASTTSRTNSIYATEIAEALTYHLRGKLALFLHLSHVVVESDYLPLI